MTIADVRADLADACRNVSGLKAAEYMPDQIHPPMAVVTTSDFDPRMVMAEGKCERHFVVSLYAGRTSEGAAQKLLDGYMELSGATSVIAAIQAHTGLNGNNGGTHADYAEVTNVSGLKVATFNGVEYLLIDFDVEVVF